MSPNTDQAFVIRTVCLCFLQAPHISRPICTFSFVSVSVHLGVPLQMYGSEARGRLIWADRPFWGTAAVGRPRSSLESTFIRAATYYLLLCIHKAFFVYLQLLSRPILASSLTIFFLHGSPSHAEGRACLNLSSFSPLNAEHIKSWLLRLLLSLFMRRLPTRRSEDPAVDERQPSTGAESIWKSR